MKNIISRSLSNEPVIATVGAYKFRCTLNTKYTDGEAEHTLLVTPSQKVNMHYAAYISRTHGHEKKSAQYKYFLTKSSLVQCSYTVTAQRLKPKDAQPIIIQMEELISKDSFYDLTGLDIESAQKVNHNLLWQDWEKEARDNLKAQDNAKKRDPKPVVKKPPRKSFAERYGSTIFPSSTSSQAIAQ